MKRTFAIIAACIIGGFLTAMIPLDDVAKGLTDLITVFGVLAGLLAQMIALTAVIFEPGSKTSSQGVRDIGSHVRGLQTLNIALFFIYVTALVLFEVIKGIQPHSGLTSFFVLNPYAPLERFGWSGLSLGTFLDFWAGAIIVLAVIRTFRTLFAIRNLQDLRLEIQARDAEAREKVQREQSADRLRPVPDQAGADYGTYTHLGNAGKKKGGSKA